MDGLSAAASIIAVLDATRIVISICSDYISVLRDQVWALPKLLHELQTLRSVLEHLSVIEQRLGCKESDPYLPASSTTEALRLCKSELDQLARSLEPPSWAGKESSKRRALVLAAGWPIKEKDSRKALDNLSNLKATLNLALATDQMYVEST